MAQPSVTTVSIDDMKFNATATHFSISTVHDAQGMPMMGSLRTATEIIIDMHDNVNLPYDALQKLFTLSNIVTRDKIKPIKLEFWQDDAKQDALCTFSFNGWISNFSVNSGGEGNHLLSLSLQPTLDQKNFVDLKIGN